MRLPWHRRADEEKRLRVEAENRHKRAELNWPVVHAASGQLRAQRDLNGWTGIADTLFASRREGSR